MRDGAFALIDCLGFKGIWKRSSPDQIISKLRKIEDLVTDRFTNDPFTLKFSRQRAIRAHVRLLSDTVAISFQFADDADRRLDSQQEGVLAFLIVGVVQKILEMYLEDEPHLLLRGCISYGAHICESNFICGPAVDEAAQYMDIAEGAFVWMLPDAAIKYRCHMANEIQLAKKMFPKGVDMPPELRSAVMKWRHSHYSNLDIDTKYQIVSYDMAERRKFPPFVIDPYEMPIKQGEKLKCTVVNPLFRAKTQEERDSIVEIHQSVMRGNSISIWLKHQHTISFLEEAMQICTSYQAEYYESVEKLEARYLRSFK